MLVTGPQGAAQGGRRGPSGGVSVFDMPRGVTPVRAELHDSLFSNGVSVNLR
jgi:hypothetical protein